MGEIKAAYLQNSKVIKKGNKVGASPISPSSQLNSDLNRTEHQ